MKTVKKLFSLLLVAILLVSAVPFNAAAEEVDPQVAAPEEYRVNFQLPSGSWKNIMVQEGSTIPADSIPTITAPAGKEFVGWSFTQGGNAESITEKAITAHTNVYCVLKDVHTHDYSASVTAETCTTAGYTTYTCACGDTYTEAGKAATGHKFGDWTVTTEPTATTVGIESRSCTVCQETETREIGKATTRVTFYSEESGEAYAENFELYQRVTYLPTPSKVVGKEFKGWYDAEGNRLKIGDTWSGEFDYYEARYIESNNDGLSTLSVYARFYVDGVQQGNTTFLYSQVFADGDNVLQWLNTHESTTYNKIFSVKSSEDYEWEPRYYYEFSGNEPLAEQDLIADGDKSIVVKVYAKKTAQANVLLYVHTKATASPAAIFEMKGYTAGNTVTLSAAKTIIKNNYTGSNMTVTGLYTDATWEQLLNGENPTAANGVTVTDNGTLTVHVLLKNATASSGKASDSTNPQTGDTIMITVSTMVISAAALLAVMELRKRKMI